jgi:hypothetical protein
MVDKNGDLPQKTGDLLQKEKTVIYLRKMGFDKKNIWDLMNLVDSSVN